MVVGIAQPRLGTSLHDAQGTMAYPVTRRRPLCPKKNLQSPISIQGHTFVCVMALRIGVKCTTLRGVKLWMHQVILNHLNASDQFRETVWKNFEQPLEIYSLLVLMKVGISSLLGNGGRVLEACSLYLKVSNVSQASSTIPLWLEVSLQGLSLLGS
ncbi:hypothetical protein HAX54_005542 [Datura stramonium]|uniref:Uncharacterized protein n=1 Tax=Datura stramonium TaxID=4076 RepID=A0ABS8TA72_DATST|nr:hypothetical protein [Datura stramonium]